MMQAASARGINCWAKRRARGSAGARVAAALCAALSGLWGVQRADAAVDLNGLWDLGLYVTRSALTLSDHCSLTITQTDNQLELSGNCQGAANPVLLSGSYDPDSHQFTGGGSAGACGAVTMRGVVGADFKAFAGDFDCSAFGVSGGVNASRCGNGQIDEGEECDDGNRVNGDCCAAVCKLNRAGTACSDDGSPCTSDVCDATGQCQHIDITGPCDDHNSCTAGDTCVSGRCVGTVQPDDSGCDDGNGCTAGDRCAQGLCTADPVVCPACLECAVDRGGCVPAISNGCEQASATSIVLRRLSTDSVSWRWQRGDSTSAAALGDPTGRTGYDFCLYDGNADAEGTPGLVLGVRAPAGADWSPSRHGFGYTRADRNPGGLRRVLLNAGSAGKSRLAVKGLGDALALPALQGLTLPLTVQLKTKDGRSTQCWTAEYGPPLMQNPLVLRAGHRTRLPDTRPNILVVNLDDTRADGIDRMPNVARLAAQGVSFTNSFVVNPLCAPSRASLFSGLYSQHNGVLALGGPIGGAHRFRELGSDRQTIAVWMHEAGYRTGMFGKYVNGYGFGGTEQVIGAGGTYYVPPGWTRWRAMASPEHYGGERGGTYKLVDEHGRATRYDDHTNDGQYSTDVLGAEVRSFVSEAVAEGRPFFAVWAPYASHGEVPSFTPEPASRHFGFFHYLPAWRPPSFAEPDVSDKPRGIQALINSFTVQIFNSLIRVGAYESLLAVDEQLQRIIDALVELGVDDNTVIIFTSDNGVELGRASALLAGQGVPIRGMPARTDDRARPAQRRVGGGARGGGVEHRYRADGRGAGRRRAAGAPRRRELRALAGNGDAGPAGARTSSSSTGAPAAARRSTIPVRSETAINSACPMGRSIRCRARPCCSSSTMAAACPPAPSPCQSVTPRTRRSPRSPAPSQRRRPPPAPFPTRTTTGWCSATTRPRRTASTCSSSATRAASFRTTTPSATSTACATSPASSRTSSTRVANRRSTTSTPTHTSWRTRREMRCTPGRNPGSRDAWVSCCTDEQRGLEPAASSPRRDRLTPIPAMLACPAAQRH